MTPDSFNEQFMYRTLLLIGLGGFIGSTARHLCNLYFARFSNLSFPAGTFVVNITGCLLIGIIFGLSERNAWLSPEWRMFLATGICGGFTTFSTFSIENMRYLQDGNYLGFAAYAGGSVLLGLVATFAGFWLAK